MYHNDDLVIFALNASKDFGERVVSSIGCTLTPHEEITHPDMETKVKPVSGVGGNCRGRDVYIIQSLYHAPHDEDVYRKFVKLLIMNNAVKHASAARITNVVPYLLHTRQERKTESRAPLSGQEILSALVDSGMSRMIGCSWHEVALQNALYVPCDILDAYAALTNYLLENSIVNAGENIVVVAPDNGAMKQSGKNVVRRLEKHLGVVVRKAYIDKERITGEETKEGVLVGDVNGATVIIPDDESVTGKSLTDAAYKSLEGGARKIIGMLAHCKVSDPGKLQRIEDSPLERVVVSDTIYKPNKFFEEHPKFELCSVASLFGEAIRASHENKSINELFQ